MLIGRAPHVTGPPAKWFNEDDTVNIFRLADALRVGSVAPFPVRASIYCLLGGTEIDIGPFMTTAGRHLRVSNMVVANIRHPHTRAALDEALVGALLTPRLRFVVLDWPNQREEATAVNLLQHKVATVTRRSVTRELVEPYHARRRVYYEDAVWFVWSATLLWYCRPTIPTTS
ncbi:MAG: hypothetical protein WCI89_01280 [bacterium]